MRVNALTTFFDSSCYLSKLIFFYTTDKIKESLSFFTNRTPTQRSGKMQHLLLFFLRKLHKYFFQFFLDRFHIHSSFEASPVDSCPISASYRRRISSRLSPPNFSRKALAITKATVASATTEAAGTLVTSLRS